MVNITQVINEHGFLIRDLLGTILNYKRDHYVHFEESLNKADLDRSSYVVVK